MKLMIYSVFIALLSASSASALIWKSGNDDALSLKNLKSEDSQKSQKRFVFSPQKLEWSAYDESGDLIASGPASGGADYCPDVGKRCRTVVGEFEAYSRKGAKCRSSIFPVGKGGAPMPYCTFFHKGYAVHGSYQPLDANKSHGCVRVSPEDAQWLYENFLTIGTKVVIEPYKDDEPKVDSPDYSLESQGILPET